MNLRTGPGSKYKIITTIKSRETVDVIEKTNSLWMKVGYNGKIGYLSSKYVIPIIAENPRQKSKNEYSNSALFLAAGIIVIFILIVIILSGKNEPPTQAKTHFDQVDKSEDELKEEIKQEVIKNIFKNITVTVTTSSSDNFDKDDSIIDVTGNSYAIKPQSVLVKYPQGVPFWPHHYVYSHTEIKAATTEQINFYNHFKNCFLKQEYFDLEGNTNYAFILLFDLINDYKIHQDITRLEKELDVLGQCYPKTNSYAVSLLIKEMESKGDSEGISRIRNRESQRYQSYNYYGGYDPNEYRLGNKFKGKLNLNDQEVSFLNKFWNPNNVFLSIEGCCIETIKLYLAVLQKLDNELKKDGNELTKEIDHLKEGILQVRRSNNTVYWSEYENSYLNDQAQSEIFNTIFKRAENCVREFFGHKRKISSDFPYQNSSVNQEFEERIGNVVNRCIEGLKPTINPPDKKTEILLNFQNVNRWKNRFEILCKEFEKKKIKEYVKSIHALGAHNKKNPNIEHIYFEASKFIAKYDKIESLNFYIYYLYHDLKSVKVDNKQHSKTIQKTLFKTNEQLHNFEIIVGDLIKNRDLKKALKDISTIYIPQRKKIQLDNYAIKEVTEKHSGTVELLNEYLNDEYEDENNSIKMQEINSEEMKIEIASKSENIRNSIFKNEINLTQIHTNILERFAHNDFSLSGKELDTFAKTNRVFKNQLIESINDNCYEYLDDVLIEEEQEKYVLNRNYYQRILKDDR